MQLNSFLDFPEINPGMSVTSELRKQTLFAYLEILINVIRFSTIEKQLKGS